VIYLLLAVIAGAAACGVIYALTPRRLPASEILKALDRERAAPLTARPAPAGWRGELGAQLARALSARGIQLRSLRADLAILERDLESLLAVKVLLAGSGLLFVPALWALMYAIGLHLSTQVPAWGALAAAAALFVLPDLEVRSNAASARAEFRRVVGTYLDLIAMSLEGGRGIPEALTAAAEIGHGPVFDRLRRAVTGARLTGASPWSALGELGREIRVDELLDLALLLDNVADQGARVRTTLTERARTLRARRTAEIEEMAGGRDQSMLIAQMLLATGFLAYLMFPALFKMVNL
jgi:Flp pilus assembly protein TadB